MERRKDVWTDTWPDHYLAGTWAPKYRKWSKTTRNTRRDPTLTDRFQSTIHLQPSWYPYDEGIGVDYSDKLQDTKKFNTLRTKQFSTSKSYKPNTQTKTKPKSAKENETVKKLTWNPNDYYEDERGQRSRSKRSKSAHTILRNKKQDGLEYYHDCQHEGNCNPVGEYYNMLDPWRCRFCGGLDTRRDKHSNCACLADKVRILVDDPISILNNEHRAHREIRREQRRAGNAEMRSVEEMAYRMNMAAKSRLPIDYRNHMECKVPWRM